MWRALSGVLKGRGSTPHVAKGVSSEKLAREAAAAAAWSLSDSSFGNSVILHHRVTVSTGPAAPGAASSMAAALRALAAVQAAWAGAARPAAMLEASAAAPAAPGAAPSKAAALRALATVRTAWSGDSCDTRAATVTKILYGVHSRWENTAPAVLANPAYAFTFSPTSPFG